MKLLKNNKSYSFFTRMLLISTIILAFFSVTISIIVVRLSHQYEEAKFLKSYELAAINLAEAIDTRFANYVIMAGSVLEGNHCNPDLCSLLEASSYDEVPAVVRKNCLTLLTDLCRQDQYLNGFLLLSLKTENLYYFNNLQANLFHTDTIPAISNLHPYSESTLSLQEVDQMITACTGVKSNSSYYGIAATLYRTASSPVGYLIPLYSVSEYQRTLNHFDLEAESAFSISNIDNELFFNSNPALATDDPNFYTYTAFSQNSRLRVTCYVRKIQLRHGSVTYLTVILALLMTLFSFAVYYFSYLLSNRSINGILSGMAKLNINDLSYRIEKPSKQNEFTQIIEGFNSMCDKLQYNVERSYIYELQQKKSELYALQTSINPHFLYNTLEMIRVQILNAKPNEASQMVLLLSKIYRVQTNTNMFVTLEAEAELCENLMCLYQYRFQNFTYEYDIDDCTLHYALPKNTVQPLIENYFVHGIMPERNDNLFLLSARMEKLQEQQYIRLSLCNNGNPIDDIAISELERKINDRIYTSKDTVGFALTNVSNRFKIVFQDKCQIHINSGSKDMSFQIEFLFPAMTVTQLQESFS